MDRLYLRTRSLVRLWSCLGDNRGKGVFLLALLIVGALFDSVGLAMLVPTMSLVLGNTEGLFLEPLQPLLSLVPHSYHALTVASLAAGFFLLKNGVMLLVVGYSTWIVVRIRDMWRKRVVDVIFYSPGVALHSAAKGTLIENALNQPVTAARFVRSMADMATNVIFAVGMVVVLTLTSGMIGLVVLAVFGIFSWTITVPLKRYSDRMGRHRLKVAQQISRIITEALEGLREIKIFSLEKYTRDKFLAAAHEQARLQTSIAVVTAIPAAASNMLIIFGFIIIVAALSFYSNQGAQSFVPMASVFIIVSLRLNGNLMRIVKLYALLRLDKPGFDLMNTYPIIKRETSVDDDACENVFCRLKAPILFDNIGFSHIKSQIVLSHFNMAIVPGQVTALVGPSGSGKSTIVDLLCRLIEPTTGRILVNGVDLRRYDVEDWRRRIAIVSQHTFLFNTTIRENIRLGKPTASDAEIIDAAERAGAHEFIERLENGYDAVVGDRGAALSGGQAQRIAIARALIRDADIYIFDEPTSALDEALRGAILKIFQELADDGKVVLIISHQPEVEQIAEAVCSLGERTPSKEEIVCR